MALESSGLNLLQLLVADQSKCKQSASHLWTHLTPNETEEIVDGNVSPRLMEQHHHITPNACAHGKCSAGLHDPMKVCPINQNITVGDNRQLCLKERLSLFPLCKSNVIIE